MHLYLFTNKRCTLFKEKKLTKMINCYKILGLEEQQITNSEYPSMLREPYKRSGELSEDTMALLKVSDCGLAILDSPDARNMAEFLARLERATFFLSGITTRAVVLRPDPRLHQTFFWTLSDINSNLTKVGTPAILSVTPYPEVSTMKH